ncbi:response regulator transcription factor [Microvirga ossetica]|uniref:response regulator n=1 Tax=Microvirga ossetica TaxID=1882682 RepID=UPI003000FC04
MRAGRWSARPGTARRPLTRPLATRPDVVVLDYALPLVNGVEATRQIRGRVPGIEVLIFTMHDTDSLIRDVLEAGARGFLLKSDAKQFLSRRWRAWRPTSPSSRARSPRPCSRPIWRKDLRTSRR